MILIFIGKWFEINGIHTCIHPDKTKVTAFGSKRKLSNKVLSVKYKDKLIEYVDSLKYWGRHYTQLLQSNHISNVCCKISRSIGFLRRIKCLVTHKILIISVLLPYFTLYRLLLYSLGRSLK